MTFLWSHTVLTILSAYCFAESNTSAFCLFVAQRLIMLFEVKQAVFLCAVREC